LASLRGIEVTNATDIAIVNNLILQLGCIPEDQVTGDPNNCATPWAAIHAFATVTGPGRIRIIGNAVHPEGPPRTASYGIVLEGSLVDSTVQANYTEGMTYGIKLGPYNPSPGPVSGTVVVGNRVGSVLAGGAAYVDQGTNNHWADNY